MSSGDVLSYQSNEGPEAIPVDSYESHLRHASVEFALVLAGAAGVAGDWDLSGGLEDRKKQRSLPEDADPTEFMTKAELDFLPQAEAVIGHLFKAVEAKYGRLAEGGANG